MIQTATTPAGKAGSLNKEPEKTEEDELDVGEETPPSFVQTPTG